MSRSIKQYLLVSSLIALGIFLLPLAEAYAASIFRWENLSETVIGADAACRNGMILHLGHQYDEDDSENSDPKMKQIDGFFINEKKIIDQELFSEEGDVPPKRISKTDGEGTTIEFSHLVVFPVYWAELITATTVITTTDFMTNSVVIDDFSTLELGDSPEGANFPVENCYLVKRGDTLIEIASKVYGDEARWRDIFQANRDKIRHPNRIYPGQKLDLP
jgi:hypothetical protein